MPLMHRPLARLLAAALLLFKAAGSFFATALTIAYETNSLSVADALGQFTAGDDYRRLIPVMDAIPAWIHGFWILAGLLYLDALARMARRAEGAHLSLLAAVGVEGLATALASPIVAATGVVVTPGATALGWTIPYLLPVILAVLLWRDGPPPRVKRSSAP
jgi:hypothetical protein